MRINNPIYLLLFCLVISACSRESSRESRSYQHIDASFSKEMTLKLSDFAESIQLIPLQTNEESLINKVGKIIVKNNRYYIGSASMRTDKILVFGEKGNYLYKLDKKGQGPDEYLEIEDFDVMENSNLLVLSHSDPRMYIYDIEHDLCLMNKRLDVYPLNLIIMQDRIFLYNRSISPTISNGQNEQSKHILSEFDLQGNLIDSYFEPDEVVRKKVDYVHPINSLNGCEQKIFFNYPWCDTIYEIKNQKLLPAFYLDYGDKKLPERIFKKEIKDIFDIVRDIKNNQGIHIKKYYNITPHFIHFTIQDYENNGYIAFYDRKNDTTLIGHHIVDDIYLTGNKYTIQGGQLPKNMDGDELIWTVEPNELKKACQAYKDRATKAEWMEFLSLHPDIVVVCENSRKDNNPILIRIKIKTEN